MYEKLLGVGINRKKEKEIGKKVVGVEKKKRENSVANERRWKRKMFIQLG